MATTSRWAGRRLAVIATAGALTCGLILSAGVTSAAAAKRLGSPNTWVATGPIGVARSGQTATLLPNGKVLVAGGGTARAELYNPATRTFSSTGQLPVAVTNATATLLPDGNVLVAGGLHGSKQVATAELYNPATGTWSATGSMNVARSGQSATLLRDGKVLVAGGGCNGTGFGCDSSSFLGTLNSAELYDPATGTWARTGSMKFGRQFHTATLLGTGKVLVAGGFDNCDDSFCTDLRSAELYDPSTGRWTATGSMSVPREQHSATLLRDGEVLVAGGLNQGGFCCSQTTYSSAELYNPATATWSRTASMAIAHAGHTATLLGNGWVLVAGGGTSVAEIYQPRRAIWVSPGAMSTARTHQTATLLRTGHVLVTGGTASDGQPLATAEEFLTGRGPLVTVTPASIAFGGQHVGTLSAVHTYQIANVGSADLVATGVAVTGKNPGDYRATTDCAKAPVAPGGTCRVQVRFAPAATQLRIALAGVSDNAPGSPHGARVSGYGIGPNSWAPTEPMAAGRQHATATLLSSGKVLIAGGESSTGSPLATAELYNPATRSFSATGSLHSARVSGAATLLRNGEVLYAGGLSADFAVLNSAELYNPATGTWSLTTPMNDPGYAITSTLLPSGSVLVTGLNGSAPAEVYNPETATWTNTGPMTAGQVFATATLLPDGKVLLAAGLTSAAELYDPATNTWKATGSLHVARQSATAVLLRNGRVLVAGGALPNGGGSLASAELYNPATGRWSTTGSMTTSRYGATATLLPDGGVLVAGGCNVCSNVPANSSAEVYNQGFWSPVASMIRPRVFQTATLLPDGTVLLAGGAPAYDGSGTTTAEFYTPS